MDGSGRELARAPCPGEEAMLSGMLEIRGAGRLPPDRWVGPFCVAVKGVVVAVVYS